MSFKWVPLIFMWANVLFMAPEGGQLFYLAFVIVWAAIFVDFSIRDNIDSLRSGSIEVRIKEVEKKDTF